MTWCHCSNIIVQCEDFRHGQGVVATLAKHVAIGMWTMVCGATHGYNDMNVGIRPLKIRHDVTKLDLTISFLSF